MKYTKELCEFFFSEKIEILKSWHNYITHATSFLICFYSFSFLLSLEGSFRNRFLRSVFTVTGFVLFTLAIDAKSKWKSCWFQFTLLVYLSLLKYRLNTQHFLVLQIIFVVKFLSWNWDSGFHLAYNFSTHRLSTRSAGNFCKKLAKMVWVEKSTPFFQF